MAFQSRVKNVLYNMFCTNNSTFSIKVVLRCATYKTTVPRDTFKKLLNIHLFICLLLFSYGSYRLVVNTALNQRVRLLLMHQKIFVLMEKEQKARKKTFTFQSSFFIVKFEMYLNLMLAQHNYKIAITHVFVSVFGLQTQSIKFLNQNQSSI